MKSVHEETHIVRIL